VRPGRGRDGHEDDRASTVSSPFASILHREAIRRLVDDRTFDRGVDYHAQGRVSALARHEAALSAKVRGTNEYRVRLWVKEEGLAYSCSCPMGADGAFCKHGVAVGLAWLAQAAPAEEPDASALRGYLSGLEKPELVEILLAEAAAIPSLRERLARRQGRSR
jgi:uncharacterized Zn finger protein